MKFLSDTKVAIYRVSRNEDPTKAHTFDFTTGSQRNADKKESNFGRQNKVTRPGIKRSGQSPG